jgi:hypothetical protein
VGYFSPGCTFSDTGYFIYYFKIILGDGLLTLLLDLLLLIFLLFGILENYCIIIKIRVAKIYLLNGILINQ